MRRCWSRLLGRVSSWIRSNLMSSVLGVESCGVDMPCNSIYEYLRRMNEERRQVIEPKIERAVCGCCPAHCVNQELIAQ